MVEQYFTVLPKMKNPLHYIHKYPDRARKILGRLIHRQEFEVQKESSIVSELSVDGGNVRVRTTKGGPCSWKGYKATVIHDRQAIVASFQENDVIINWVNSQELAPIFTYLGDLPGAVFSDRASRR